MDMMSGLIASNAPIGQQDVMGNFLKGQKYAVDARKTVAETGGIDQDTRKKQYQQDMTEKLQRAIHNAVDPTSGVIDPDKFKLAAHQEGVEAGAIDYALENIQKVWATAKSVAQSKQAVGAMTEGGTKQVEDAARPAGTSWTVKPAVGEDRGSFAAPPSTSAPAPEKDTTGFTTPDMEQPASSGYKTASVGVEGAAGAGAGLMQDPSALDTAGSISAPRLPGVVEAIGEMKVAGDGADDAKQFASAVNPLSVADMDKETQDKLLASMRQEGTLPQWNAKNPDGTPMTRGDYLKQAQAAQDAQFARSQAGTVVPTRRMFIDKEGNFDQGAYERAKAEYPAKQAAATAAYVKEIGGKYGEQFTQAMTTAANRRAETQLATEQARIASTGAAVDESTQNINDQLNPYGFKPLSPLLIQNADATQKEALKDGAKAYATVVALSRKLAEEKRPPTVAEVNGATNNIMALDGMGSNLSNEQKVSSLANSGFLDKLYQATLGDKPTGEAIKSAVAQTLMSKLTKGETLEDIAKSTSYTKLHEQFEGESKAFAGPGWAGKPAKAAKKTAPASHKEGDTWSDAKFNYRMKDGKIQRKAK